MGRSIRIPANRANSLKAPDFLWPAVTYEATLEMVEAKGLPSTKDGEPFAGYLTTDGKRLSLMFGDLQPQEEVPVSIGNRKWFEDVVLEDGSLSVYDDPSAFESEQAWSLARSQRTLANLFNALVGSSDDVVLDEAFVESLERGDFNGQRIGLTLYHTKKKDRTYVRVESFHSVA